MSKLRELVEQGPTLCEAKNPERWAALFAHAFDSEVANRTSVFAQKPEESVEDRLEILQGLHLAKGVNADIVNYWIGLLTLCAYSYAVTKGREELAEKRNKLAGMLSLDEGNNHAVASVMTVSEASTLSTWL